MYNNQYAEMMHRHQNETMALPIKFAFDDEQFAEMMAEWGLAANDTYAVRRTRSAGGYYRREDSDLINTTFARHKQELALAITADKNGTGFIYDMFSYELANCEYCVTCNIEPVLVACGLNEYEVLENNALYSGLVAAKHDYMHKKIDW